MQAFDTQSLFLHNLDRKYGVEPARQQGKGIVLLLYIVAHPLLIKTGGVVGNCSLFRARNSDPDAGPPADVAQPSGFWYCL
jgi:hypothetical protein